MGMLMLVVANKFMRRANVEDMLFPGFERQTFISRAAGIHSKIVIYLISRENHPPSYRRVGQLLSGNTRSVFCTPISSLDEIRAHLSPDVHGVSSLLFMD
jgi:hypothetical protein